MMGKEIKLGDFVAYAQRHSSSLWVNIGKVLKVGAEKITVRGAEDRWNEGWKPLTRNSVLSTSSRIVLVEPSEEIQNVLKDFIPQLEFPIFQTLESTGPELTKA